MPTVIYYDLKATHEGLDCRADRYLPHPTGGLQCLDCGRMVMLRTLQVIPFLGREEAPPIILEGESDAHSA